MNLLSFELIIMQMVDNHEQYIKLICAHLPVSCHVPYQQYYYITPLCLWKAGWKRRQDVPCIFKSWVIFDNYAELHYTKKTPSRNSIVSASGSLGAVYVLPSTCRPWLPCSFPLWCAQLLHFFPLMGLRFPSSFLSPRPQFLCSFPSPACWFPTSISLIRAKFPHSL